MARMYGLDIRYAYPGVLGPRIPEPPAGYIPYGTGYVAIDREGDEVVWNGNAWVVVIPKDPPRNT